MPQVTVTVDVPEINEEDLREAVIAACAERILGVHDVDDTQLREGRRGDDPDDFTPVRTRVEGPFIHRLRAQAEEALQRKVREIVEARTAVIVDEILAGEFQPVTRFGDPRPKTTLRAMIGSIGTDYLTQLVDNDGSPSSYSGNNRQTRLHFLVRKLVAEVFQAELKGEVTRATKEFKESMAGKLSGEISDTVNRLLGLK